MAHVLGGVKPSSSAPIKANTATMTAQTFCPTPSW